MKQLFFFISIVVSGILSIFSCYAQTTFQKTYSGILNGTLADLVQPNTDGGFVIAGYTSSFGAGFFDVYLIKTDSVGDTLWTKTFGGTSNDWASSVSRVSGAFGGYIITGTTWSFGAGYADVYLIRTDINGDMLWTKTYGGANNDYGRSIQQTVDSGYVIAGYTNSFGAGGFDIYLIKTDVNGDTLWTKTYGGTGDESGGFVQQTADSGYIIAGNTNSFGAGLYDIYLIKTNSVGDTLWTKTYGGTDYDSDGLVKQTADGGYIVVGSTESFGAGMQDVYLIKTNANGDMLWTKTYGGPFGEGASSIQQTSDGGYIISGSTRSYGAGDSDAYLIKTDANGDILWTKTFGGADIDFGGSVQQTADDGYIIIGLTKSFNADGNSEVYMIKTDANGNSGVCYQDTAGAIVTNPATVVSTTGTVMGFGGTVNNTTTLINNTATVVNDITSLNLTLGSNPATASNNDGTAWVVVSGGTPPYSYQWDDFLSQTTQIALVLAVGTYTVVVTDPNGCIVSDTVTVTEITSLAEEIYNYDVQVYPNPFKDNATIEIKTESDKFPLSFKLYNPLGRVVMEIMNVRNEKFEVNRQDLSSGIYFYQISDYKGKFVNGKVVIQ